jgi:hypothetical protein
MCQVVDPKTIPGKDSLQHRKFVSNHLEWNDGSESSQGPIRRDYLHMMNVTRLVQSICYRFGPLRFFVTYNRVVV